MKRLLALILCAVSLDVGAQETVFNVDMTCAPSFENLFVTGPWCGWCANAEYNTMTDPDGDGVYTVVLDATVTGAIEYKYAINGFADQENLVNDMNDGASCAPITDNNSYANRLTDQGSTTYDYYGTCDGTCNDVPPTPVLFRVDMSEYESSFSTVNLNGSFNGWCGSCATMSDDDQDMVYELAVDLDPGVYTYKFTLDGWITEEVFMDGDACTSTINGFVNRTVEVFPSTNSELDVVCWNSCDFCGFVPTPGCTDGYACNYNADATEDDGSCYYGCGCTNPIACNFDSLAITDNGSCFIVGGACDDLDNMTVNDVVNEDCLCEGQEFEDEGCTIEIACNYNPYAINDDNSCVFVCPGCTDSEACNFDAGALQEDGTCSYPEDSGWCNCEGAVSDALGICGGTCDFDNDSDGVCDDVDDCIGIVDACGICNGPGAIYPCGCSDFPEGSCSCDGLTLIDQCGVCDGDGTSCVGCMYDFACTYDAEATIQDVGLCEFGTCAGCLDPLACNYNPTVNGDDGSCEYPVVYLDCSGNCLNDANGNGVCDEYEIFGCAYPSACNFDPQVTVDDGSCDYSCVESFCEADYDFGNASWGFSPNPNIGESFAEGTVNVPYSDVLQVLLPTTLNEVEWYSEEIPLDSVWFGSDHDTNGILTDVVFTDMESNENFMAEDIGFVLRIDNPETGEGYTHLGTPGGQICISIFGVPQRASTFQFSLVLETYLTYYGASYSFQYSYTFSMSVVTASIGCTDPDACNYQPTAVEDDGSCGVFDECGVCLGPGILEGECDCDGNVTDAIGVCGGDCLSDFNANSICDSDEVLGCTYGSAENYNPQATSDDGTCVGFEGADSGTCLFDGDGDGFVGSGDLLGLLSEFGIGCN